MNSRHREIAVAPLALHWWAVLSGRHKHFRLAVGLCLFTLAYYLAFKLSADWTGASPSPLWIPNSILLCALLRSPPRYWWVFLLITVPIRLTDNVFPLHPVWYRLGTTAISAAQALLGAGAFRRIAHQPFHFGSWRSWLALGAVLVVAAAAAFPQAALRHALGQDFWRAWQLGFVGDAMAQLVITPALLTWLFWRSLPIAASRASRFEAPLVLVGLILTTYYAYSSTNSLLNFVDTRFFLPIPFLYWAGLRFGMAGASIAVPIVAFFAMNSVLLRQSIGLLQQTLFFEAHPLGSFVLARFLLFRTLPVYIVAGLVDLRSRAELSVRESEARFRVMANTTPALIWMSGTDKLCDFFNQVWLDFTGRALEQELGNGWTEGVHPDDLEQCLETYVTAFDARRPFRMEYRLRNREGQYRWMLDIGVPRFDTNSDFCGYIGSLIDITEQRQAQEGNANIAHLQRLAQLGELTASIAHELRQPLSAILLHTHTLQAVIERSPKSPEIKEILADIDRDGRRANDVIVTIRNIVRKQQEHFVPIDVNAAVLTCISLISPEAVRRRTKIVTELADHLPSILGAPTEITQVLLNLVSNALDAMDDLASTGRVVTLRTARNGDMIEITVLDRGHGIKAEHAASLFDSFFTTRSKGIGLGLSIVRSIVQAHRGKVWAENLPAGGTAFHVALPIGETLTATTA